VVAAKTPSTEAENWQEMLLSLSGVASLSYCTGSLICRKIFRHAVDGFTSPSKEVVLRVTLVPMSSTLTITPSRTTIFGVVCLTFVLFIVNWIIK
jgi:hypothetical protein